jgi:hypothetical protein
MSPIAQPPRIANGDMEAGGPPPAIDAGDGAGFPARGPRRRRRGVRGFEPGAEGGDEPQAEGPAPRPEDQPAE